MLTWRNIWTTLKRPIQKFKIFFVSNVRSVPYVFWDASVKCSISVFERKTSWNRALRSAGFPLKLRIHISWKNDLPFIMRGQVMPKEPFELHEKTSIVRDSVRNDASTWKLRAYYLYMYMQNEFCLWLPVIENFSQSQFQNFGWWSRSKNGCSSHTRLGWIEKFCFHRTRVLRQMRIRESFQTAVWIILNKRLPFCIISKDHNNRCICTKASLKKKTFLEKLHTGQPHHVFMSFLTSSLIETVPFHDCFHEWEKMKVIRGGQDETEIEGSKINPYEQSQQKWEKCEIEAYREHQVVSKVCCFPLMLIEKGNQIHALIIPKDWNCPKTDRRYFCS